MPKSVLAALLLSAATLAGAADSASLRASDAWARATAPGAPNGGVFLTLANRGKAADRLLKATATVAASVELHTHTMDKGVARMAEVPAIEVPAGKTVELKPGGLHVMLIGLRQPLKEGEKFPLTLQFEKAGAQSVEVSVRGVGAGEHSGHAGH